jgi:para-nitrobenzyl esterase
MIMKKLFPIAAAALFSVSAAVSTWVFSAESTAPAKSEKAFPANSTSTISIGEFIDNAKLKPILDKYLPGFSANEQVGMARGLTLRAIQSYSPDTLTDDALGKIDADVAKVLAP